MGHIQDRWYKTVNDPSTDKAVRVKTALCGNGLRYKVRYLDPDGNEKSRMYPDKCKKQAEEFCLRSNRVRGRASTSILGLAESSSGSRLRTGSRDSQRTGATRGALRSRLDSQIYPHFGALPINSIKSATVRGWLGVRKTSSARTTRQSCSPRCRPSWTQR
jgi:hypothetical protein